jgi:hypothetical protein
LSQRDGSRGANQNGADAGVGPMAKGEVPACVAFEVQPVWVGKPIGVSIGLLEQQRDTFASGQSFARILFDGFSEESDHCHRWS